jgi:hypothetical protein
MVTTGLLEVKGGHLKFKESLTWLAFCGLLLLT